MSGHVTEIVIATVIFLIVSGMGFVALTAANVQTDCDLVNAMNTGSFRLYIQPGGDAHTQNLTPEREGCRLQRDAFSTGDHPRPSIDGEGPGHGPAPEPSQDEQVWRVVRLRSPDLPGRYRRRSPGRTRPPPRCCRGSR